MKQVMKPLLAKASIVYWTWSLDHGPGLSTQWGCNNIRISAARRAIGSPLALSKGKHTAGKNYKNWLFDDSAVFHSLWRFWRLWAPGMLPKASWKRCKESPPNMRSWRATRLQTPTSYVCGPHLFSTDLHFRRNRSRMPPQANPQFDSLVMRYSLKQYF